MERLIILIFAILTLLASCIFGEVVPLRICDQNPKCSPKQVKVTPCTTPPCKVKRGSTASIEVDFTPNFVSQNITAKAYWDNGIIDVPFADLDHEGCKYTTCPTQSGVQQTYKYGLKVINRYPFGTYDVKWKLIGDNKEECCILFKIKIIR